MEAGLELDHDGSSIILVGFIALFGKKDAKSMSLGAWHE
jgi:hypothetical protein